MTLNPFYVAAAIYFIANFIGLISGVAHEGFEIGFNFISVSKESYVLAFAAQIFFISIIVFFYRKLSFNKKTITIGDKTGWIIFILQISYFLFSLKTGAGLAGSDFKFESTNYLNVLFVFIQVDLLFLVAAPLLKNKRIFLANCLIYLISTLFRGWMGGVFLVTLAFLINFYPIKVSIKTFAKISIFLIFILATIPALEALKWGIRTEIEIIPIIEKIYNDYDSSLVASAGLHVINRFQHINNVAVLVEEQEKYFEDYYTGKFKSYWANGFIFNGICRFFNSCGIDLNTYLVHETLDIGRNDWNVDPGVAGWGLVTGILSPLFVIFFAAAISIPLYVSNRKFGTKGSLVIAVYSLPYLFHGWLATYINMLIVFSYVYFAHSKFKF